MLIPVLESASILEWSLSFCIMGVSFKSTSLKLPLEPFEAEPANSDVFSAFAISIASFASVGKNNRANATRMHTRKEALPMEEVESLNHTANKV